jgi:hypothetical protein
MGLDVNQKLLRRFYEALILLGVLDPTRGRQPLEIDLSDSANGDALLWRDFLDSICFICDSKTGGDTVTSVGAEQTNDNTIFWMASNSKPGSKLTMNAQKHLSDILYMLRDIESDSNTSSDDLHRKIYEHCVGFSSMRIKTYRKRISDALMKLMKLSKATSESDDEGELLDGSPLECLAETSQAANF